MDTVKFKIAMIHLLAFLLACAPFKAAATSFNDYEVDWPSSPEKGVHVLRITIDGCTTLFKIKDKDFYDFAENKQAVTDALKKAIARTDSGCKN